MADWILSFFWLLMQFRQNGQRDDRRRRVLRDELLTSPPATDNQGQGSHGQAGDSKTATRGYSTAVAVESQPPISCLIATRPWTLSVLLLAGLAVITGLQAAYANIFHGTAVRPDVTIALDVAARGSLAAWFSSVLLAMAAINSVLVYWLRSHKLDDYRGRYRVWLWAALGLLLASVDAGTGLHSVVAHLLADRFNTAWLQNPTANGVVILWLVLGSLGVRLGVEIWSSQLARLGLLVAGIGYLLVSLMQLEVIAIDSVMLTAMAKSTTLLLAHLTAAMTIAAYCRYVHLESQGTLKARRPRRKVQQTSGNRAAKHDRGTAKTKPSAKSADVARAAPTQRAARSTTPASKSSDSKFIRCDSAHQSVAEPKPTAPAPNTPESSAGGESTVSEDPLDFDPETGERLSKAERRRLRKQMRRQKRAGAG